VARIADVGLATAKRYRSAYRASGLAGLKKRTQFVPTSVTISNTTVINTETMLKRVH